jgi:hypothetical protein
MIPIRLRILRYCFVFLLCSPIGVLARDHLWSARLDNNGRDDVPAAVAIDSVGSVYVAGSTRDSLTLADLTVAYDASGAFRWVSWDHADSTCPGAIYARAAWISAGGNPIIGGNTTCEAQKAFAMALSAGTGSPIWNHRHADPSFFDPFGALVPDQEGGAFLVTDFDIGPWFIAVYKLSSAGAIVWSQLVNGTDSIHASTAAVAQDRTLYIAGTVESWDIYVMAMSNEGVKLWSQEFDFAPDKADERSVACTTDFAGNLAVLVRTRQGAPTGADYEVLKLDRNGDMLWYETYDAAAGDDSATGIACGPDGSVFVTGKSWGGPGTGYDISTIKFDPAGGPPVWEARVSGVGNGVDEGESIAVDAAGHAYVAGSSYQGATRGSDILTLSYDPDGGEVWRAFYTGPGGEDAATDLELSTDRVVVAGRSKNTFSSGYDFVTIAYSVLPVAVGEAAQSSTASILVTPNPTAGLTRFHVTLPTTGRASLRIYDIAGRLVRILMDRDWTAGQRDVFWEGRDERGTLVAQGVYFCHLISDHRTIMKQRVVVVR